MYMDSPQGYVCRIRKTQTTELNPNDLIGSFVKMYKQVQQALVNIY